MISEPALKKLRNKLLIINVVSLTLVVTIAFSLIYLNFYNNTQSEIDKSLMQIPRDVHENVALSNQAPTNPGAGTDTANASGLTISGSAQLPVDYSKSFVVNVAGDGSVTVFSLLDLDETTYVNAIETVLKYGYASGETNFAGRTWRYNVERGVAPSAAYALSIVFLDIDDRNIGLGVLAASLIVIGIIAIGAILLVSMLLANRAIKPVEEGIKRHRRFVADASHELKTPIAVIAANIEAASGAVSESGDVSCWIENIADEASRMNELVENLLSLAKAEEKQLVLSEFDLAEAASEEADRVEAFLFEKGVSFDIRSDAAEGEAILMNSDKTKVQAVISILLENAVKYTPAGGNVCIAILKNGVSVSNTGTYITPDQLARLFDRFYRADPSRNSETGGHGIGLSIAREIVKTLGGEIKAESFYKDEGCAVNTFTLTLPA